ncbi:hypothetical protein CCP4SC76_7800005 [Gammaproteobacteria bacterium]
MKCRRLGGHSPLSPKLGAVQNSVGPTRYWQSSPRRFEIDVGQWQALAKQDSMRWH